MLFDVKGYNILDAIILMSYEAMKIVQSNVLKINYKIL